MCYGHAASGGGLQGCPAGASARDGGGTAVDRGHCPVTVRVEPRCPAQIAGSGGA